EEGAIAEAFKKLARAEKDAVLPALATAQANRLPAADILREWSDQLDAVLAGGSDDCVRMLAGEGKALRDLRERASEIRSCLTDANLEIVQNARIAVEQLAAALRSGGQENTLDEVVMELGSMLASPDLADKISQVRTNAETINSHYQRYYKAQHARRFTV